MAVDWVVHGLRRAEYVHYQGRRRGNAPQYKHLTLRGAIRQGNAAGDVPQVRILLRLARVRDHA